MKTQLDIFEEIELGLRNEDSKSDALSALKTLRQEHVALNAIAEAAKEVEQACNISNGSQPAIRYVRARREILRIALDRLDPLRAQGGGK